MPELGDEVDPAAETPAGPTDALVEGVEAREAAEAEVELVADPELVAAVPLARQALAEITPERTIGEPLGHVVEAPGVVSLLFASLLPGYPDWRWTNLVMLVVASALGLGLVSSSLPWLAWEGYLFRLLGADPTVGIGSSNIGVVIALAVGLLTPIVSGVPAVRRQERAQA